MTQAVKCPDCENKFGNPESMVTVPDDFDVGDIVECLNCCAQLEIIAKKPYLQVVVIEEEK